MTKHANKLSKIEQLKRTNRWILWIAAIIIFFLLLGMLIMGYASNWWQEPETADRTGSFSTDSGQNGSSGTSGQNGGGGNGSGSTNTSRESSSTTNNTTTNNNTTNDNTNNSKSLIETLLEEIEPGDDIDTIIARATQLGIDVDCSNTLIAVQECKFSAGDYTITTKNLITDDGITGILNNLTDL